MDIKKTYGEYKGYPTLRLQSMNKDGRPTWINVGLAKAKLLLEAQKELQEFVDNNGIQPVGSALPMNAPIEQMNSEVTF